MPRRKAEAGLEPNRRAELLPFFGGQAFGMGEQSGEIIFIQHCEWTSAVTNISISNNFTVASINKTIARGRDPAVDRSTFVPHDLFINSVDILKIYINIQWLDLEIPEQTLQNPHTYCKKILGRLVSFPAMDDNDLLVVVAHDVTILPILFSVFGKPITSIGFLNGVVITGGSGVFEIQYADADNSLKAVWRNE